MKKKFLQGLMVSLGVAIANIAFAQSNSAKTAINLSNRIYFSSFQKNDAAIFADRYADDCMIMPPDSEPFTGRKGALAFFKLGYDAGLRNGKFITDALYGDGENYVTGRWQSINATGKITDDGKFLVLWKRTPKGWKMFRDSFSSNHPVGKK